MLITELVIRRLENLTRYGALNRLTTDRDNVKAPGVTEPPMKLLDEAKLRCLGISITEPWRDPISGYRAMNQILDGQDASSVDNNAGAKASDISDTGDNSGTGSADNNTDGKNTHAKAGFNTYNIASINTNADAGDMTGTGDAGGTGGTDNNIDGKNAYAKAGFKTNNILGANADVGASMGDTINTVEKVSNNTNNTNESQSSRVGRAIKGSLGRTDESGMDGTNIKTRVGVDEINIGGVHGANIEADKKIVAGAVGTIDNSADSGVKPTD